MLNLLAFDYGASSGRAILGKFDGKKIRLEEIHRFENEPVMTGDRLYWDILRLFHEMKRGIIKGVSKGNSDIASIGIDTWGVDFGLLDASGRLLGNPIHYRDRNTEGMIEKAGSIISCRELYEKTGTQIQVFNTLYQLLSMRVNQSPLLERAATLLFIPDLLRYFLTGEKSTEYTIASTSQMLDPRSGEWDKALLDQLGIPKHILTGIIAPGTIAGRLTPGLSSELGTGRIPVVAVAEHDTGSAVVSIPAENDCYAYLSSGTWSLLGVESSIPVITDETYRLNFTNEGGLNRSVRLLKNIMGLWIYQECVREWNRTGPWVGFDALEKGARQSEPFRTFIDPDDACFYRPGDMPGKIAEYCRRTGQRIPETKPQIVRCIMESLALKYRMTLENLEKVTGHKIPVLHIVGGGCQNSILSQFTANAIARPVIAGPVEATAMGNIVAQLLALAELKDLSDGRRMIKDSFSVVEYIPTEGVSWDAAYERFLKILAI